MMLSFASIATISMFWSLCGYSLAFGPTIEGNTGPDVLGDMHFGLFDSSNKLRPGTDIPEHAYFVFQMQFAIITAAVVSGAVCERICLWAWCVFSILWSLLVYVPTARALFYGNGFLAAWGALDFAGGVVVEQGSGVSAFVLAAWLDWYGAREKRSPRKGAPGRPRDNSQMSAALISRDGSDDGHSGHPPLKPHNLPLVLLGAGLLYVGWMGE
jgi:Amt family ammonium transporter